MSASRTRTGTRFGAALATAVAVVVTVAAGCSAPGAGGDSGATSARDAAPQAAEAPAADGAMGADLAASVETAAREVVTTGSATLLTDDPADAAARIAALTERDGGRVELREETRGDETRPATARLTLRVRADRVTATLDALGALGEVTDVSLTKEDVTATGRDLDARIAALETSTARLTELMAQAGDTEDLLRVEQELAARQGELDALKAQRAGLSDRVAMSTLDVYVAADESAIAAVAPPPTGFRGGLEKGWDALMAAARALAVALGAALPWLAAAGVGYVAWRGLATGLRRVRAHGSTVPDET